MHKDIYRKVENYLDGKLGRWTRLLVWRHELSDHLHQAYENKLTDTDDRETAWNDALNEFGDIEEVSTELKLLHKPENICIRLVVVLIAIGLIVWAMSGALLMFVHVPILMLLVSPLVIGLAGLMFSSGLKLKDINRYCNFSLCAGAIAGILLMLSFSSDPSQLGMGAALAILSSLYAIIFLDVGFKSLCFYVLINISAIFIIMCSFYNDFPLVYEMNFVLKEGSPGRLSIIVLAGILAGWARWGIRRLPQYMLRIAVGIMVVFELLMLQTLSSPDQLFTNIVLSMLPLLVFPLLGKIIVSSLTVRIQR